MIGATRIMRFAGAAEAALQECRPAASIEEKLGKLAQALTTLREEADIFLDAPERPGDVKAANPPNVGNADIDELCVLLECHNLEALDKFSLFSPTLSGLLGAVRFDRLRDAIDNLNFQLGAELLREALPAERIEMRVN
jgi:hypothetical protein